MTRFLGLKVLYAEPKEITVVGLLPVLCEFMGNETGLALKKKKKKV